MPAVKEKQDRQQAKPEYTRISQRPTRYQDQKKEEFMHQGVREPDTIEHFYRQENEEAMLDLNLVLDQNISKEPQQTFGPPVDRGQSAESLAEQVRAEMRMLAIHSRNQLNATPVPKNQSTSEMAYQLPPY
jgi:hypothetical protein